MSAIVGLFFATFLCYITYIWLKYFKIRQKLTWLPSIAGWPIVGNALEFGDTSRILQDLSRLLPKQEKVVLFNFFGNPCVIIADYDFLEFILSNQNILSKGSDYRFLLNWLGTGLLTSDGAKWKSRRRIITPAFHFSILEQFIDVFEYNEDILIERLKKVVGQDSIDIYPFITLYALDVICETAMGVKVEAQNNESSQYVKNVKLMCKIGMIRSTSIIKTNDLLYPLTFDYYREKSAVKQLHSITNSVIDERRNKVKKNIIQETDELGRKKRLAFLDILLKSTIDGQALSKEDIREEVDTFMFEGHDTTASAMTFCTYFLAAHPEVQKKALAEQASIFEDDILRPATYKDLLEMKYLECVIKESLRLCPSVPMYSRLVNEDVYYKGNVIPKGTDLLIFTYGVLRDPDYYPNPEKFDPSRFEKIDGTKPYQYIPFSAGPRNCIGQKFAMLEMKSTLSKLLRNFEILPSVPKHNLILVSEAVLKSKNGVRVKLVHRKW